MTKQPFYLRVKGAQYLGMGRELYDVLPYRQETINVKPVRFWVPTFVARLIRKKAKIKARLIYATFILLTSIRLLKKAGYQPDMVGLSNREYSALT